MATWTTIPDTSLEPGKPIRSIDALALRDNPIAIAEGAAGAPALATTPVLNATAGASVGAVGTYAWLSSSSNTTGAFTTGTTYAGSGLRYVGHTSDNTGAVFRATLGGTPSGTWRAMGSVQSINEFRQTLFLRIS